MQNEVNTKKFAWNLYDIHWLVFMKSYGNIKQICDNNDVLHNWIQMLSAERKCN